MNEIKRLRQLAGINEIKINNPTDPLIVQINQALSFIEKDVNFYENDTDTHNIANSVSYYIQANNSDEINNKFWDNFDFYNKYINSQIKKYPNIYQKFGNNVINEIKRLQYLAGINEITINKPGKIKIGRIEIDEDNESHVWIDEEIVLKYLLPEFPNREQDIIDFVEGWNDWGATEEEVETTIKDLKINFLNSE